MFIYNAPTKLFIDCEILKLGEIIKSYGYKKVLFVYGGGSIKKSGLYDQVVKSLNEYEVEFIEEGGVEPNPKVSFVRSVLNKKHDIDFVLAVGGGSVIDTAKSIAVSYLSENDPWDYNSGVATPTKALPVGIAFALWIQPVINVNGTRILAINPNSPAVIGKLSFLLGHCNPSLTL